MYSWRQSPGSSPMRPMMHCSGGHSLDGEGAFTCERGVMAFPGWSRVEEEFSLSCRLASYSRETGRQTGDSTGQDLQRPDVDKQLQGYKKDSVLSEVLCTVLYTTAGQPADSSFLRAGTTHHILTDGLEIHGYAGTIYTQRELQVSAQVQSGVWSNQIVFFTCFINNRCRLTSEMLKRKIITQGINIQWVTITWRYTRGTSTELMCRVKR
jgi:hypothetical protein